MEGSTTWKLVGCGVERVSLAHLSCGLPVKRTTSTSLLGKYPWFLFSPGKTFGAMGYCFRPGCIL